MSTFSRREVLKAFAVAPIGAQSPTAITVAGQPVEILVEQISPVTMRVSVVPRGQREIHGDGSLVDRRWQPRRYAVAREAQGLLQIGVSNRRFAIDPDTAALTFAMGRGPLFGLGEGGPQFDRRGSTVTPRSGQGGYQLRTHGGRVPIQWLIDPERGALFVHQPYGTFDLTGAEGRFEPAGRR
ncbi:MAG TPA: hypothetical protein VIW45_14260, partial [Vicinamibacterales bacterium]